MSKCGDNRVQWPLFSLPVGTTKARLGMCQGEVRVCLQALLRRGSSHGGEKKSGRSLAPLGKHNRWEHNLFSPMAGAGCREYGVRPNYPFFHLSPQTSCALTTPIVLSMPRRSASQWRCCSQMRACRNTTKSSPLSRQLPHFPETLTLCFLSLYSSPHLPPKIAQLSS